MSFGMPWHLGAFCVRSYKILFSYAYFGCWPFLTYPCASSKRYSGCSSWKSSKFLTFKRLFETYRRNRLLNALNQYFENLWPNPCPAPLMSGKDPCPGKGPECSSDFFRQWQNLRIPENYLNKDMMNNTTNLRILWRNRENLWKYPFRYKDNKGLWEYLNILG